MSVVGTFVEQKMKESREMWLHRSLLLESGDQRQATRNGDQHKEPKGEEREARSCGRDYALLVLCSWRTKKEYLWKRSKSLT
jgi:hypothetical protein